MTAYQEKIVRFLAEERLQAVEAYQRLLVERGLVPDASRLIIRKSGRLLAALGAIFLGVVTSFLSIVVTFLIFNSLFHI